MNAKLKSLEDYCFDDILQEEEFKTLLCRIHECDRNNAEELQEVITEAMQYFKNLPFADLSLERFIEFFKLDENLSY